jgi:hypothetical protein
MFSHLLDGPTVAHELSHEINPDVIMREPTVEWASYQIPLDPVPRNTLGVMSLGGGNSLGRRRVISLAVGVLAAACLVGGFCLPWTVTLDWPRHPQESVRYWDCYPRACGVVALAALTSFILLCANRARNLILMMNLVAAGVVLVNLGDTRETNALINEYIGPRTILLVGPSWPLLVLGTLLNFVASMVQPPSDE